jgi:hypothetical protein
MNQRRHSSKAILVAQIQLRGALDADSPLGVPAVVDRPAGSPQSQPGEGPLSAEATIAEPSSSPDSPSRLGRRGRAR